MQRSLLAFSIVISLSIISCGTSDDTTLYDVSVTVSPSDAGTITPSADSSYEAGEQIQLQANPNTGYVFAGWNGRVDSTENPLTLTVDRTYILTANFELKTYPLTITTEGVGNVHERVVEPKSKEYKHGTVVELYASRAEGWKFTEWQGDLSGTDNPIQITVDGPKQVMAKFDPTFYLADNGVTILCPEARVGESGTVDGVTYIKWIRDEITPDNASTACTSGVTNMSQLFINDNSFNEDISHWDVSSVKYMNSMFIGNTSFNQDIGNWDVSRVRDMGDMFSHATSFNQDISGWDVGRVTNMEFMFNNAISFNQDISSWDVSSVEIMRYMFWYATSFNQDLSGWCVSNMSPAPKSFSTGAPLTAAQQPVWGTCPE